MGVIWGRRHGLIANLSRLRNFGHHEARSLNEQICQVEAAALKASQPGATLGEVVEKIRAGYNAIGRASEFENHHQGGLTGYRSREVLARPGNPTRLDVGMALAWNPSLPGAKVEDTFLLTEAGLENLTADLRWPLVRGDACVQRCTKANQSFAYHSECLHSKKAEPAPANPRIASP